MTPPGPDAPSSAGAGHLALALDVDDLDLALRLIGALRPWFSVAKVGLELFAAAGPAAFEAVRSTGAAVFADLKLHDIPTTVGRAARLVGRSGARYCTVHGAGGTAMVAAAVEALRDGAADAGHPEPCVLGVTVLTSEPEAPAGLIAERAARCAEAGCGGLVCAAADIPVVRSVAPGLLLVVPGIRPSGTDADDQRRPATPAAAIAAGADLLVVGRAVTAAPDPAAAAAAVAADVAAALHGGNAGSLPGGNATPALQ